MTFRIGTRSSKLALAQANWIKEKIETRHGIDVELVKIKTTGDKILDSPLSRIGGKGLFVKEIEEALIDKAIDVAVHSMKDVPAELPPQLFLCSFPKREDPRDVFISKVATNLSDLPKGATVGTSSLRRSAQILSFRPDIDIVPLRGNVDTRLEKLESKKVDGIILAAAGLARLGLEKQVTSYIHTEVILPAVGQGALGLETRRDDEYTYNMLVFMNHRDTELAVRAERAFLKRLEGGCQIPMAAYARINDDQLSMEALVASLDGKTVIRDKVVAPVDDPEKTGIDLADRLILQGAKEILDSITR